MYANLTVKVGDPDSAREVLIAHSVRADGDGITILLDDDDDASSYPVHVGERELPRDTPIEITANF